MRKKNKKEVCPECGKEMEHSSIGWGCSDCGVFHSTIDRNEKEGKMVKVEKVFTLSSWEPRGPGTGHRVDGELPDEACFAGGLGKLCAMIKVFAGLPTGTKIKVTMERIETEKIVCPECGFGMELFHSDNGWVSGKEWNKLPVVVHDYVKCDRCGHQCSTEFVSGFWAGVKEANKLRLEGEGSWGRGARGRG